MAKGRVERDKVASKSAFDNLGDGADKNRPKVKALELQVLALIEAAKMLKKLIPQAMPGGVKPATVKSVREFNELTKAANDNAKNKLQIDKKLKKEQQLLQNQSKERNKLLRDEILLEQKQLGTLERLQIESRQLRTERSKLNLTTKQGVRRAKEINAQLDKNNRIIEKNSDKLKKQNIGIGRYQKAISGLKGALGRLGLAFGVFSLIKGSFTIIKDFDQAQADLASVLGVNRDAMKALTDQSKELGATTKFTASQVSELQKEFAKLGFTQKEIQEVTGATLELAAAAGTELARAATVAGATIRGFGLDTKETQRVVDVMAKSFSSSSLDMEKFATSMSSVAPVAKTFGFSIEETTALLGVLTDSGIEASTAGTGLKNMMLDANKAGLTFQEALDKVNESSDKAGTSFDLFGKRGAVLGVILAENGEKVAELTGKLEDSEGAAKKMAETQLNTLGGSLALLKSAWEGQILAMDEAGGAGEKLRSGIRFLAKNLGTIVKVIGQLIQAFIAFKVALFALKMSDRIKEFSNFQKSVKDSGKAAGTATTSVKAFGNALKSIGFAGIILLITEIVKGLWDIVSGASEARIALAVLNKQVEAGNVVATEFTDKLTKSLKDQINEIRKKNLNSKDEAILIKAVTDATKKELEAKIATIRALKIQTQANKVRMQQLLQGRTMAEAVERGEAFRFGQARKRLNDTIAIEGRLGEELKVLRALQESLGDSSVELEIDIKKQTKATDEDTDATNKNSKAKRFNTKAIKDNDDAISKGADRLAERLEMLNDADEQREISIARLGVLNAEIAGDEEAIIKAKIVLIKKELEIRTRLMREGTVERLELEAEAQLEIQNLLNDTGEKNFAIQKEWIDLTTDYFVQQSDRRIKKIDEEIAASIKQRDFLKQLAVSGEIDVKESLAAENKIIAEANAKKEQEEKRKQQILLASSVIQAFNSNLANGDSSGEAFVKAITSTTLLTAFISALPTFMEGTEDTGINGRGIDGKGGFNAVLHPKEGVLKREHNEKKLAAGMTNESMLDNALKYQSILDQKSLGAYFSVADLGGVTPQFAIDNSELVSKMDDVQKAIKEIPVPEIGRMTQKTMEIVEKKKQGNITTTNVFIVK